MTLLGSVAYIPDNLSNAMNVLPRRALDTLQEYDCASSSRAVDEFIEITTSPFLSCMIIDNSKYDKT